MTVRCASALVPGVAGCRREHVSLNDPARRGATTCRSLRREAISVTDPLLLRITARTKRSYCTWRADITWRSGDQSGVIRVDNHGRGYAVAGSDDTESYGWTNTGWTAYGSSWCTA